MKLSALAVSALLASATGCGGSGPGPTPAPVSGQPTAAPATPPPTFLYVHDSDQTILTYAVDEGTGALSLRTSTKNGGTNAARLVGEPAGRTLFDLADVTRCCHSPVDTELRTFDVAADGSPTFRETSRLPLREGPLSPIASSRFLYVAARGDGDVLAIHALPVGSGNGGGRFGAGGPGDWMAISSNDRLLYAAGTSPAEPNALVVSSYGLGPDGLGQEARSLRMDSAYRTPARSLALDPGGRFVYVAVEEMDGPHHSVGSQVRIVATDPTGSLNPGGSVPAPVGHLLAHPNGRFLFQSRGSEVDVYAVDERRTPPLTLLYRFNGDPQPVPVEAGYLLTRAAVVDPSGRFLFGAGSEGIWGYAVDAQNGALRYLGILAAGTFDRPLVVRRP